MAVNTTTTLAGVGLLMLSIVMPAGKDLSIQRTVNYIRAVILQQASTIIGARPCLSMSASK